MALDEDLQLNQSLTLIERHALLEEIYNQQAQFPIPPPIELNDLPYDVLSAPELSMYDPAPLLPRFTGAHPNKWLAYAERYFTFYKIHNTERFPYVLNYFYDEAAMWLSLYQFTEWSDFIVSLMHRFGYPVNALQVFDEMPDRTEPQIVSSVHETIDDMVLEIQTDSMVDVHASLGVTDSQMDISDYNFVLEHVKPCLQLVLTDVSKENAMVATNVCNDGFLVDSMVLNSFAWKPGRVTNNVQVSPRKFVLLAVNRLKFQFDGFAMVIASSNSPFGGKLQETYSGFVPTPPTVTIVCEKRNTIGTFGSLLSGSYFGADGLRNFSFDPGPNRIYKRYFNCIIHIFEPIDTVVLEFGTSILVLQGLSALRLYFFDDDPNPTDACTTITDTYSAGMPSAWYYNTNQYMNEIETLCCQLASVVSELHSDSWGVNVQPYSGTTTNFAAYTGLLSLGDRIIGFYTPLGWHTSHGYYTPNGQNVSGASNFLETFSFKVDLKTCVVDFEEHEAWAVDFHPKILVCGWIIFHRKSYKATKRGVLLHQNNGNDQYGLEVNIYFVACPSLHGGPHHNHNADLDLVFSSSVELPWKPVLCFFYFARDQLLGWKWGTLKLVFSMDVVAKAVRDPPDFIMVPYRAFGYVMVQPFELKVVSQGQLSSSSPCCISRGCFITVAWVRCALNRVRCALIKGSDELKCLTCDNLLTTIVQYAHLGMEFEEWFLACLCTSHYTFDKGALKLTNLSAGVNKSPRRHLNIPWIVEKLSKVLDYYPTIKWKIYCVHAQLLAIRYNDHPVVNSLLLHRKIYITYTKNLVDCMIYNSVKLLLLYRRQNIDKFEIWVTVDFLVLTYAFWDTLTFWANIDLSTTNGIAVSLLYGLHFDNALMELLHERIFSMANLSPPTTCTPYLDGQQVVFGRAIKGIRVICSIAYSTNFDVIIAVCGCISKGTDETLRLHVSVMIVPFNWPQFPYNKVKFLVRAITSFDALYGHKPPTIPCSIYDSSGIANYEAPMLDEIASLLNPFTSLHLEDKVYFKGRGNIMNPPNQLAHFEAQHRPDGIGAR